MYEIKFLRKAISELKKIDPIWQIRIKEKIILLAEDPLKLRNKIKPLKGKYKQLARLQFGNYRIIFKIQKKELIILIIRIAHRKEVYIRSNG